MHPGVALGALVGVLAAGVGEVAEWAGIEGGTRVRALTGEEQKELP